MWCVPLQFDDLVWEEFGDCEDNAVSGGTLEDWTTGMDRRKRARKDQVCEQNREKGFQESNQEDRVKKSPSAGEYPGSKDSQGDGNEFFSNDKEAANESEERETETSALGWNMISNDHACASSGFR